MATTNSETAPKAGTQDEASDPLEAIAQRSLKRTAADHCDGVSCSPGGRDSGGCGCGDDERPERLRRETSRGRARV
jgi:hypothetical protein